MTVIVPGRRDFFEEVKVLKSFERLNQKLERRQKGVFRKSQTSIDFTSTQIQMLIYHTGNPTATSCWDFKKLVAQNYEERASSDGSTCEDGDCLSLATTMSSVTTPLSELSEIVSSQQQSSTKSLPMTPVCDQSLGDSQEQQQSRGNATLINSVPFSSTVQDQRILDFTTASACQLREVPEQQRVEFARLPPATPVDDCDSHQLQIHESLEFATASSTLNASTNKASETTTVHSRAPKSKMEDSKTTMNISAPTSHSSPFDSEHMAGDGRRFTDQEKSVLDLSTHWSQQLRIDDTEDEMVDDGENYLWWLPHPSEYVQYSDNPFSDEMEQDTAVSELKRASTNHSADLSECASTSHIFSDLPPPAAAAYSESLKSEMAVTTTIVADPKSVLKLEFECASSVHTFSSESKRASDSEKRKSVGGKLMRWLSGRNSK